MGYLNLQDLQGAASKYPLPQYSASPAPVPKPTIMNASPGTTAARDASNAINAGVGLIEKLPDNPFGRGALGRIAAPAVDFVNKAYGAAKSFVMNPFDGRFSQPEGAPMRPIFNPFPADIPAESPLKDTAKMVVAAPREVPKAIATVLYSTGELLVRPWQELAAGKNPEKRAAISEQWRTRSLPFLGDITTEAGSFKSAALGVGIDVKNKGVISELTSRKGLGASWGALVKTAMDVDAGYTGIKGIPGLFAKPRGVGGVVLSEGAVIKALSKDFEVLPKAVDQSGTYLKINDPAVAKTFGGSTSDTFFKIQPSSLDGGVEVMVVQKPRGVAGTQFGVKPGPEFTPGQYGLEKVVMRQVVDGPAFQAKFEQNASITASSLDELKSIRTQLSKSKEGFVQNYLNSDEGSRILATQEVAASNPLELNRSVVQGIKNNPYYVKEGTLHDMMGSGTLMERNGRSVVARADEVADYVAKGYKKSIEIDQLAQEQGFTDGNAYLEAQLEMAGKPKLTDPELFAHKELLKSDTNYQALNQKIEEIKSQIIAEYERQTSSIESRAGKRTPSAQKGAAEGAGAQATEVGQAIPEAFPNKPIKGTENMPITQAHIANLKNLAEFNNISPAAADMIAKAVTGKLSLAEFTEADYVLSAKAIGGFAESAKYSPTPELPTLFGARRLVSPRRMWMKDVNDTTPWKVYDNVYVPIENSYQTARVLADNWRGKAREILGEYQKPKFAPERQAMYEYADGRKSSILDNPAWTEAQKAEMISRAEQIKAHLNDIKAQVPGFEEIGTRQNYMPHMRYNNGEWTLYREEGVLPPTNEPFFAQQREGMNQPVVSDILAASDIYANAASKAINIKPTLERMASEIETYPPELKQAAERYLQEKAGMAGKLERTLNNLSVSIAKKLGRDINPQFVTKMLRGWLSASYQGVLGFRPAAAIRNLFDPFLTQYAKFGSKFLPKSLELAADPAYIAKVRQSGFLVEHGVPYGEDILNQSTRRAQFGDMSMKGYEFADMSRRVATHAQGDLLFHDALDRLNKGEISYKQFEERSHVSDMSISDRKLIQEKLSAGDAEGAFKHFIRDAIDELNFPYRKGSAPEFTDGLTGKTVFQFSQYPVEYAHMLGNWIKRGQWDKLVRFAGITTIAQRTIQDITGIDVRPWTGLNQIKPTASSVWQFGDNMIKAISSPDNVRTVNTAKDEILKQLTSVGIPGGVELNKLYDFKRSLKLSKTDPTLKPGEFGVYTRDGKKIYNTDFHGIFVKMLGFPIKEDKENRDTTQAIFNAKDEKTRLKTQSMRLFREGDTDAAVKIWTKIGWSPKPSDFDAYFIPANQRYFQALPPEMQAEFLPRVYPQAVTK